MTYRLTPGPQTRIGRVLVGGLVQTREEVVRRELPFRPGDPFNPEPGGTQAWSRCFAVQDVDIPTLELNFQPDFNESAVFFAVR